MTTPAITYEIRFNEPTRCTECHRPVTSIDCTPDEAVFVPCGHVTESIRLREMAK
jgi:hypothetical protein